MLLAGVWLVVLIGAVIIVACIVLHNKRRTHLCPDCEDMYDPTETETFGRCPTCKTP